MFARYLNHAIGIIIIVSAIGIAFATTQLTVSNNVTINVGMNLKALVIPVGTTVPICSSSTGTYGETGLSMNWNLNQGGSQTRYLCVYNAGTVNDVLQFGTTPLPNGLTINNVFSICANNVCTSGTSLVAGGYALATMTLSASQTSTVGTTTGAFTITIM